MKRWRSALAFVGLLLFACMAAALLHRLGSAPWARIGWRHLSAWLRDSPPEDAAAALLRVIALGLAYWLLVSALLYASARASRIPAAVATAEWLTLPVVRRLVDRAVAVAVVASAAVAPAVRATAGPSPAPPPIVIDVGGEGVLSPPSLEVPGSVPSPADEGMEKGAPSTPGRATPGPSLPPTIGNPPSLAADAEEAPGKRGSGGEAEPGASSSSRAAVRTETIRHHDVVPGDNLWDISAAHLARVKGVAPPDVSNSEVHAYWVRVIDANRASLRSGEPNLIYPGERVELPPVREASE